MILAQVLQAFSGRILVIQPDFDYPADDLDTTLSRLVRHLQCLSSIYIELRYPHQEAGAWHGCITQ